MNVVIQWDNDVKINMYNIIKTTKHLIKLKDFVGKWCMSAIAVVNENDPS